MARKKPIPRLVCYDIADPKRLGRVHRIVTNYALPIQYSVYYMNASADDVEALSRELREVIDPKKDDIRIYPLRQGEPAEVLGKQRLTEGILLIGAALPEGFSAENDI